jgi:hypothetical protein
MTTTTTSKLATTSSGRVLIHLLCLLRQPTADRRRWHWQGIVREFTPRQPEAFSSPNL